MSQQLQSLCLTRQVPHPKFVPVSIRETRELNMFARIAALPTTRSECLSGQHKGLLHVQEAGVWMQQASQTPVPRMLFGEFWHEDEVCILYADTNLGKSILAVQLANSISKGKSIGEFKLECHAQQVLYLDFEMSTKQFATRYTNGAGEAYTFSINFHRAELNPDAELPKGYSDFDAYLMEELERAVVASGAKVVIVDNLTYLKDDNERAKDATPLMKHLKRLKEKHGLSLLVLAHTPKRDQSRPISKNDLAGSKMLMNFCDSAFAIGESSQDSSMRYLKQVKARNTEIVYNAENVCLCQLEKPDSFLHFTFTGSAYECEMLQERPKISRKQEDQQILELKKQGLSNKDIGLQFGVTEGAIRKRIKKLTGEE